MDAGARSFGYDAGPAEDDEHLNVQITRVHSDDNHRREIPEGSGAICVLGYDWNDFVKSMYEHFLQAAPELKKRNIMWILRAHRNGMRIEFYEDDSEAFKRMRAMPEDGMNGRPQIHAGRITWL